VCWALLILIVTGLPNLGRFGVFQPSSNGRYTRGRVYTTTAEGGAPAPTTRPSSAFGGGPGRSLPPWDTLALPRPPKFIGKGGRQGKEVYREVHRAAGHGGAGPRYGRKTGIASDAEARAAVGRVQDLQARERGFPRKGNLARRDEQTGKRAGLDPGAGRTGVEYLSGRRTRDRRGIQ